MFIFVIFMFRDFGSHVFLSGEAFKFSIFNFQICIDKVFDVCCAGPASSGAVGEETVEPHSCSPLSVDNVVAIPVVCNDRCRVSECRKLRRSRSCSTLTRWSISLLAQFIDGLDHTVTVATVEVLQIQLSPESVDIPVRNREVYSTFSSGGYGGDEGSFSAFFRPLFALLQVVWS